MQAGAQMVKMEGGVPGSVRQHSVMLVERGIPVCAHLGLTPQSVNVSLAAIKVSGPHPQGSQIYPRRCG